MGAFKEPHGGELKDLYLDEQAAEITGDDLDESTADVSDDEQAADS